MSNAKDRRRTKPEPSFAMATIKKAGKAAAFVVKSNASLLRVQIFLGLLAALLASGPNLRAQQTTDAVRKLARNPLGDAVKVPLTESVSFGAGPYDRTSSFLQVMPLIPLQIASNWLLVSRISATPVAYQPDVIRPGGGITGVGDTVATFFITPAHSGRLIWGVGPSLLIPTATDAELGAGNWDLGPSIALIVQPRWGSGYVVAQNIWSLPVNSRQIAVNQLQIETSLAYDLPRNWYLITAPTINADWTQSRGYRWLVPFGGGVGRTFNIANQEVDLNVTLYSYAIRPAHRLTPKWQLSIQCTLLYPRKRK
jgi:hypothetical protein